MVLSSVLFAHLVAVIYAAEDIPVGHLKPFGHHRPPDVEIDELYDLPDPQTFWDEYVSGSKAAIFRGAATHSPGFKLWTEEYLSETYGDLEIRLEGRHERYSRVPVGEKGLGRDTIRSFLRTFREKDTYIISQLPEPMYKDVFIPPSISCGNMRNRITEVNLWMSSGNTHSIIHKDAYNTINCLLRGTKYWKLIELKYEKYLYKTWESQREIGGNSRINMHSVDLLKYPDVAKIRWSNFTINAGDCLFLPKSYYHQVASYGDPNMAVSVMFSRISNFDDTGCNVTDIAYTPLSEVEPLWNWAGHGVMSMGNDDVWSHKANYLEHIEEHGKITEDDLVNTMVTFLPEMEKARAIQFAKEGWKVIDPSGKGFLVADDINAIDLDTWRLHLTSMRRPEPSNTEEFEYFYFEKEHIEDLLEALIEAYPEKVSRETFIKHYTSDIGGTEKYGNEIFDGLAGESNDEVTPEQIRTNMDSALEKWNEGEELETTPEIDASFTMDEIRLFKEEL